MIYQPHAYQQTAEQFIIKQPNCALFAEMGLGKTVIVLTALDRLMYERCEVGRVLVIAPKSVALNTWHGEATKWSHLSALRVSLVLGTIKQRESALRAKADVWVTNRDNVPWLVSLYGKKWPFDCVVLDESTSFKNPQSMRFKALNRVRPFIHRLIELTGTPTPNGLMDLWAQLRLLDEGERLGKYIYQYREAYFHPGARSGAVIYEYIPNEGAYEKITAKVSDICLSLRTADYLDLPGTIDAGMTLSLAPKELRAYKDFARTCIAELPDGEEIAAVTAAALVNKLLQYSSGALYDADHIWHPTSSAKLEALSDLLEQADGPVLVYYNYIHERERIMKAHPEAVAFKGEPELLEQWNAGKIRLLLCHPRSVAYGLNMQQGGHTIIWFSPTWDLELHEQANARLARQGQTRPVMIYHLVCSGTMDTAVMTSLKRKSGVQGALMDYLKEL